MFCFKDQTFCASPDCKNECGRKMSEEDKKLNDKLQYPVAYGCFCGGEIMESLKLLGKNND